MEVKINELPELTDPSGSHIVGYKGNDTVQIPTDAVVSKAQEVISDAYSATKAYTIGEYCIYNNSLYKCIANTSAGITPTNSTYWTNTSVSEAIKKTDATVSNLSNKIASQVDELFTSSYVTSDSVRLKITAASPWQTFFIWGQGGAMLSFNLMGGSTPEFSGYVNGQQATASVFEVVDSSTIIVNIGPYTKRGMIQSNLPFTFTYV